MHLLLFPNLHITVIVCLPHFRAFILSVKSKHCLLLRSADSHLSARYAGRVISCRVYIIQLLVLHPPPLAC